MTKTRVPEWTETSRLRIPCGFELPRICIATGDVDELVPVEMRPGMITGPIIIFGLINPIAFIIPWIKFDRRDMLRVWISRRALRRRKVALGLAIGFTAAAGVLLFVFPLGAPVAVLMAVMAGCRANMPVILTKTESEPGMSVSGLRRDIAAKLGVIPPAHNA